MSQEEGVDGLEAPIRRPIKLHRTYNMQQKIAENLKTLRSINRKKLRAQAIYYGTLGRDSLTTSTPIIKAEVNKQPVHERLGFANGTFVRKEYGNLSNRFVSRRPIRLRQLNGANGPVVTPLKKRMNLAHRKLLRIRQQEMSRIIRLKRRPLQPTNFRMNVSNIHPVQSKKRPLQSLNPRLQAEIRMIQMKNERTMHFITGENLLPPGVGVTNLYLHDRFSGMM